MVIAGFLSAVYGLYQHYITPEALGTEMRVHGTFEHPIEFSSAMAVLLPIIWYLWTRRNPMAVRVFLVVAGAACLYGLLLSGTRSGMLAAVGVLVLIALRQKRRVLSLALIVLLVIILLIVMPDQVRSRVGLSDEVDKGARASTDRRETYQQFGWKLFLEHPLLGTGMGGFAEAYSHSEYRFLRYATDIRRIAHNMYLEIAIGTGVLGLTPFLLLMIITVVNLQRIVSRSSPQGWDQLAAAIQTSLGAFLFTGLFASSQHDKMLWLLVGLASVVPVLVKQSREQVSPGLT
jgi:O-antigen ligase